MARKKITKEEIKEKKEKTLETMKNNRMVDSNCLRDLITDKLKWAKEEKEKGLNAIKSYQAKIDELKIQIHRLDGVIIFVNNLLAPKEEKKEE